MPARHVQEREQVEYPVVIDEMCAFRVKPHEMGAELPAIASQAVVDAEEIRVGTVDALSERDTDFRNGETAGHADGEQVLALNVALAARQVGVVLDISEDAAPGEQMRVIAVIGFDLREAFIDPMNAVSTVDHFLFPGLACGAPTRAC